MELMCLACNLGQFVKDHFANVLSWNLPQLTIWKCSNVARVAKFYAMYDILRFI